MSTAPSREAAGDLATASEKPPSPESASVASISKPTSDVSEEKKLISERVTLMIAERQFHSSTLSTQTRTISLGILALIWVILGGTQTALSSKFSGLAGTLLIVAALAVLALVADFLQSMLALFDTENGLDRSEGQNELSKVGWKKNSRLGYWCRYAFFFKLALTLITTLWLLALILVRVAA